MSKFPNNLSKRLQDRTNNNSFRELQAPKDGIDFYSNDYLGFSSSETIFSEATKLCEKHQLKQNGATGSRLISGNHKLFELTEYFLAEFHQAESALIFNSGYDANLGFFSSVPQKGDFIFYDELIHASIRDGISLSNAKAYKFQHNNIEDLQAKISRQESLENSVIYIVTEAVFSMDGDLAPLSKLADFAEKNNHFLIVDEAHSTGVFGANGSGLVNELQLQEKIFARIHTFGKAMGCHGAVILGSQELKSYLVNFARSFIYTTGLPPHAIATIYSAFQQLKNGGAELDKLKANIQYFKKQLKIAKIDSYFIESESPIQCAIVSGNGSVKKIAAIFQQNGFLVKPILSPTVPKGSERLRFCLHSFNSEEEIAALINLLSESLKSILDE
ncbi:aminotransferase class I/II-fold pyridoxal phosphate-dependent enzyme [Zunongwangia endophytica]|uniref:Aminotransferase class I/II-fold pyridoxal phosphate-dependent enzyme n=1 Tax=Zunongwangia endophytica TaxID=1808945 RepID=A0ABV8H9A7_9FLAO|nr:pyridoxal phosphate-dependent aminotransferase family protein [Zunongwangia endophytica]MDN3595642.1 pyridoxal phosphate-dependent aminotransferase family protein [Zunongwangia endophytica]